MIDKQDYYEEMSREELIRHCLAYSDALHQLRNELMLFRNRRRKWRDRPHELPGPVVIVPA